MDNALVSFSPEVRAKIIDLHHGDTDAAARWSQEPQPALSGSTPVEAWESGRQEHLLSLLLRRQQPGPERAS